MTKFILVAFGFLGFAFYELSGGAEFDGEALRLSRVDSSVIKQGLPKVLVADTVFAPNSDEKPSQDDLDVTQAAFNPVSTEKLTSAKTAATSLATDQVEVTQASLVVDQDDTQTSSIIFPSLIAQSVNSVVSQEALIASNQPILNIRSVTSNRVNVRGGPSTDFDIVGKLTRGAEVEILSDQGNGWVEMQSLDGTTIGWMADFLLTEG